MPLTDWKRAPDKISRFGDVPLMLWLQQGDLRAVCGEVRIEVHQLSDGSFLGPISLHEGNGAFGGYSGQMWTREPSPEEFETYVVRCLEARTEWGRPGISK